MSQVLPSPSAPHLLFEHLSASHQGMPASLPLFAAAPLTRTDHTTSAIMSSARKRKASEEPDNDRMSTSPSASPSVSNRNLPSSSLHRSIKRNRTNNSAGRPLPLPRLLQTLSADEMRVLLQNICDERPEIQQAIVTRAPRPSVESTLAVLSKYEESLRQAFPLGNNLASDYAYNRVHQNLLDLVEALRDYTPHFLPPEESQATTSLTYLDTVTDIIHRLPDWETCQHQRHKNEAYDDIAKAWTLAIKETSKRAGGFQLQFGGWDAKLVEHSRKSTGRLEEAVNELKLALGFMQTNAAPAASSASDERANIRQQLLSGTYGQELGVGSGRW